MSAPVRQTQRARRLRPLFLSGLAALLFALLGHAGTLRAQQRDANHGIIGEYSGEIAGQPATLHLRLAAGGKLTAALDRLDQRVPWMFTCADVDFDGKTLRFTVASIHASWQGALAADGKSISGTWTQSGSSWFVSFTRIPFEPSAAPSAIDGIWLGTEAIGDRGSTRTQIVFRSDRSGREYCTVDALDVYTMGMECTNVKFKGDALEFAVPAMGGYWSGTLRPGGNMLAGQMGVWVTKGNSTESVSTPLNLTRQNALLPEKTRPTVSYDAALPPVSAGEMEAVLDRDLAGAFKSGELAPATGGGVTIGIYSHGASRVFSYGTAKVDSIYEIGSVSKVFTGLLLAQMAAQGKVQLDEPVRQLLPSGAIKKPERGEITLLDLAAQRSGLPAMPDNISLGNIDNPYADYHDADLLAYLARHGVANAELRPSQYGSLGFAVLGVALASRAGKSYGNLLKDEIGDPLGLKDTALTLTAEQQNRMIPGRDQFHGPAKAWDSDVFAAAIGIRSTVPDMLAFLVANLHPESIRPAGGAEAASSMAAALRASQQLRGELLAGMQIGLGWLFEPETGNYWHNGATAAYSAYVFFNPKGDYAAVVLFNGSPGVDGSFVENLGRHVSQRLAGKPAISLNP